MVNITPTKILNPELDTSGLLKQIIFLGEKVNTFIVSFLNKVIPLTETQNSILLAIIYLVGIYIALHLATSLKKPIKLIIVILLAFLILGFFKF